MKKSGLEILYFIQECRRVIEMNFREKNKRGHTDGPRVSFRQRPPQGCESCVASVAQNMLSKEIWGGGSVANSKRNEKIWELF